MEIHCRNICIYLIRWSCVNHAENYTRKMFDLLTVAYSTITVSDVAHFLGMGEEDATKCMFIPLLCTIILCILLSVTVSDFIFLNWEIYFCSKVL